MTRTGRLVAALAVNAALVVGQAVAAGVAHSTGLLADAGHNLADVAAIALSLLAVRWALRPRSETRSFGNVRGTILAALLNAATLVAVSMAIVAVSVYRLINPVHVRGGIVAVVAAAALVANVVAALFLHEGGRDLNMRSALLHMVGDAAASLCVLVAGVVIVVTGGGAWDRIDPLASLVVAGLIAYQAVDLVRSRRTCCWRRRRPTWIWPRCAPRSPRCPASKSSMTSTSGASRARCGRSPPTS